jgi:cell division protein FtsB
VVLGILVYFVIWTIYPIGNRIEQNKELNRVQKQLGSIQKENKRLADQIKYLRSDEYVEQKARTLGLSKPDEEVVVVIPQDAKAAQSGKAQANKKDAKSAQPSLWQRVTGLFSKSL